jgi:hypothetical protein
MATYIVCHSGTTVTRQVANAGSGSITTRYYTEGDCNVIEKTKTLSFNSFTAVDTDFTIYFSYTVTHYVDYVWQYQQTINDTVVMPAGQITVGKVVYDSIVYDCTSSVPGDIV